MSETNPIEQLCMKFGESLARGTFARLVLSKPVAVAEAPERILGRFVVIKGAPNLSLTLRYPTRDVTQNVPVGEAVNWLRGQLGQHFRSALICTTQRDWQFISNEAGAARLIDHKPTVKHAPATQHDQKRSGFLDTTANDWLEGLSILDRDGKLRASMADKHRQISHYLEIISHLAKDCGWHEEGDSQGRSHSSAKPPLQLVDMGCGKGYLTFGVWHLFRRVWRQPVRVLGVETREDLVASTNQLARQIRADGLEFARGTIAESPLPRVDALIALHACNTATDDALRRGIEAGAKLIVVAPCCHKEVRPQLGKPAPLTGILQHGLMAERMAEWTTDGLRALFLEWAGYRTKIMEFVSGEHTPKNLMIAAIREHEPFTNTGVREQIVALKSFFGIEHHALDGLLAAQPNLTPDGAVKTHLSPALR